jgi:hypothetical protein
MLYVVEIANGRGETATKEYEARSSRELLAIVHRDLRLFPNVQVLGAWEKGHPTRTVFTTLRNGRAP